MSKYECPTCSGGFPEPKPTDDGPLCPWCGEAMNSTTETPTLQFDGDNGSTFGQTLSNNITSQESTLNRIYEDQEDERL